MNDISTIGLWNICLLIYLNRDEVIFARENKRITYEIACIKVVAKLLSFVISGRSPSTTAFTMQSISLFSAIFLCQAIFGGQWVVTAGRSHTISGLSPHHRHRHHVASDRPTETTTVSTTAAAVSESSFSSSPLLPLLSNQETRGKTNYTNKIFKLVFISYKFILFFFTAQLKHLSIRSCRPLTSIKDLALRRLWRQSPPPSRQLNAEGNANYPATKNPTATTSFYPASKKGVFLSRRRNITSRNLLSVKSTLRKTNQQKSLCRPQLKLCQQQQQKMMTKANLLFTWTAKTVIIMMMTSMKVL